VCRSDALVLFGATGDLARKKLFSSLYALAAHGRLDMPMVGVALSDWDDDRFRLHVREAIASTVTDPDPGVVDRLCARMTLVGGDYADLTTFERLRADLAALDTRHATDVPRVLWSRLAGISCDVDDSVDGFVFGRGEHS
jgi:glucose-6-phosphate 1-dehydrogenase